MVSFPWLSLHSQADLRDGQPQKLVAHTWGSHPFHTQIPLPGGCFQLTCGTVGGRGASTGPQGDPPSSPLLHADRPASLSEGTPCHVLPPPICPLKELPAINRPANPVPGSISRKPRANAQGDSPTSASFPAPCFLLITSSGCLPPPAPPAPLLQDLGPLATAKPLPC